MENKELDFWGVVALFGHTKIAGKISTVTIGSSVFVRVDVPKTKNQVSYYKFFNTSAIYDITPTDEETALFVAEELGSQPLSDHYTLRRAVDHKAALLLESQMENI
jgi:hypothetical protein